MNISFKDSFYLVLVDTAVLVHTAVAVCFAFHAVAAEGPGRRVIGPILQHHVYVTCDTIMRGYIKACVRMSAYCFPLRVVHECRPSMLA